MRSLMMHAAKCLLWGALCALALAVIGAAVDAHAIAQRRARARCAHDTDAGVHATWCN